MSAVPVLGAVVQRAPFPKGYRLFRVRQQKRNGASSVDVQPESIEAGPLHSSTSCTGNKLYIGAWEFSHGYFDAEFNSGVIKGVHHVALLCEDLETSMDFYVGVLGKPASL